MRGINGYRGSPSLKRTHVSLLVLNPTRARQVVYKYNY
jgi:hypothetical protein